MRSLGGVAQKCLCSDSKQIGEFAFGSIFLKLGRIVGSNGTQRLLAGNVKFLLRFLATSVFVKKIGPPLKPPSGLIFYPIRSKFCAPVEGPEFSGSGEFYKNIFKNGVASGAANILKLATLAKSATSA